MENINSLQASEEIEQSLMDFVPYLGVSIKEEILDETQETHTENEKATDTSDAGGGGGGGDTGEGGGGGGVPAQSSGQEGGAGKEDGGAGSPESGAPAGGPWAGVRCVFCSRGLATQDSPGTPRLMECLHSACEQCINAKIKEKTQEYNQTVEAIVVQCPTCKVNCSASGMIDQQFVVERREGAASGAGASGGTAGGGAAGGDQRCNSCSEDNAATAWCCECAEFICEVCVQAHQRLKITKDHTIKSKEEAVNEIQSATNSPGNTSHEMFCKEHTQERLSLFCETCDRLTCRDCQLLRHRDHRYQFSAEMASAARASIAALLSEVSYKRVLLGSAMKVIRDRQTLIADKKKALVHEITQTVVKLTNTINTRGKQLVLQLNEVCDSKQKTLNEKKVALEQLSAITDHCIEFVNSALEQGSDTAILYSKKQVTSHLQRIKSRRADIPNPEIPVRIHLALDKVPDLIKVISAIGAVVVDGKVHPPPTRPESGGPSPGQGSSPGQGPYHPPAPSPSATNALQAIHQQQAMATAAAVLGVAKAQLNQQPSPQPPSQLAQLSQMSAQLQKQSNAGGMLGPLGGVMLQVPQMRGGAGVGAGGAAGATGGIIRHPHVTSSTHPHHMAAAVEGVNFLSGNFQQELNLRGLLSASPSYGQQPGAIQQQQSGLQQQQQRVLQHQQQGQYSRQALQAMQTYQGSAGYGQPPSQGVYGQRMGAGQGRPPSSPHMQQQQQHTLQQQQQQQLQHQQQQIQQHYQMQQQQQQQQQQQHAAAAAAAKWHIPQNATTNGGVFPEGGGGTYGVQQPQQHQGGSLMGVGGSGGGAGAGDSFKITIRQPPGALSTPGARHHHTPTVTSTNPKTPSPNMHGMNVTEAAAHSMDKLCQDSVNDLMATIAKLDSNGVQVLAESGGATGGRSAGGKGASPLVHSSTDDTTPPPALTSDKQSGVAEGGEAATDPNEDWCAVCMDGGELMCCDKCPKVFHQYCHIPIIDKLPDETESWQCLLCVNFANIPEMGPGEKRGPGLTARQQKLIERIVLELYCQYESSLHFREPVSLENTDYHGKIKRPMALDTIRLKLQPGSPSQYTHVSQLVTDCRLMFANAYSYNPLDSVIYKDAKRLEEFFEQQLLKWLPEYAYCGQGVLEDGTQAKRPRLSSAGSGPLSIPVD